MLKTGRKTVQRIAALSFVLLLVGAAGMEAQHFSGPALGAGLPPVGPISPPAAMSPGFGPGFVNPGFAGRRPNRFGGGAFPIYWGGYGYDYPLLASPAVTNVLVMQQPAAPPPPAKPPEPIRSSIKEYKAPPSAEPATPVKPVYFVIALKNGTRLSAAAVWVQGNNVHYVDADDQNGEVPLTDIDRKATRELNEAQNLNLRLPPPAP
jgi:hypothetical protein